jgi:ketosteroid isomerase-like protein
VSTAPRATIERLFRAVEAKDLGAVLALCADDAVIIDPHYPVPHMAGKTAIAEGLRWAFGALKTMRFPIVTYCESEDGRHAAVEVATAHVAATGMRLNFPQAFFIDMNDGLITRVQAYTPYGPGGVGGLFLRLARLQWRLSGKGPWKKR